MREELTGALQLLGPRRIEELMRLASGLQLRLVLQLLARYVLAYESLAVQVEPQKPLLPMTPRPSAPVPSAMRRIIAPETVRRKAYANVTKFGLDPPRQQTIHCASKS